MLDTKHQSQRRSKDELIKHMESFKLDLKISVGIWYFTPGGGRFHEAYVKSKDIPERLEMAVGMAKYGVKAGKRIRNSVSIMLSIHILS